MHEGDQAESEHSRGKLSCCRSNVRRQLSRERVDLLAECIAVLRSGRGNIAHDRWERAAERSLVAMRGGEVPIQYDFGAVCLWLLFDASKEPLAHLFSCPANRGVHQQALRCEVPVEPADSKTGVVHHLSDTSA